MFAFKPAAERFKAASSFRPHKTASSVLGLGLLLALLPFLTGNGLDTSAALAPAPDPTPEPALVALKNAYQQPVRVESFLWPADGPVTKRFGPDHPLGIDIGLVHTPSAPITAGASGTVVFAGGDACCSYGYHVIIDHHTGLSSLYAHFSVLQVEEGARVRKGDVLGLAGATGKATAPHLHFEIRNGEAYQDPMAYLP